MSEYTDAVEANLRGLRAVSPGVCPGCDECRMLHGFDTQEEFEAAYEAGEIVEEGGFSWHDCECCGSPLKGNREPAHALDPDGEIVHFAVCVDCVLYLANGDEPETGE